MVETHSYGAWPSPVGAETVASATVDLGGLEVVDGAVYWLERRPSEGGRGVIVRAPAADAGGTTADARGATDATSGEAADGSPASDVSRTDVTPTDVTPADVDVRTLVHEYGGGDFTVGDGTLYFARFGDQRLCRLPLDDASGNTDGDESGDGEPPTAEPEPITPPPETEHGLRYADFELTPDGERLYAVRQRHEPTSETGRRGAADTEASDDSPEAADAEASGDPTEEPVNELVVLPTDGSEPPTVVARGHDFYSFPRLSPDGEWLAFTSWDHPRMPWDGTALSVARVADDGTLTDQRVVLGGPNESVFQPSWDADGRLYAVSDRTGWWNLYRTTDPVAVTEGDESTAPDDGAASGDEARSGDEAGSGDGAESGDGAGSGEGWLTPIGDEALERPGSADPSTPAPTGWESVRTESASYGTPQWVFGLSTYAHLADGQIAVLRTTGGRQELGRLDPETGAFEAADLPYETYSYPHLETDGETLAFHAGGPQTPQGVVRWTPELGDSSTPDPGDSSAPDIGDSSTLSASARDDTLEELRASAQFPFAESYLPEPIHFSYPTGPDGTATAYAYYYPPTNPDVTAPDDDQPPLVVTVHGGPTGRVFPTAEAKRAYFTSRGFAVVDVNYRGSTGYGRAYRDALDGEWGVRDTLDCVAVARYLGHWGVVDPSQTAIRGGSAGGYATLAALAFHDEFDAGASYFGVADLRALAEHTHKFESRYLDGLVGPLPDAADTYDARSPVTHAAEIDAPTLVLQGGEDRVVPPEQATSMVESLVETATPYVYVEFPEERHGFRDADSRETAVETELGFYAAAFAFDRDDVTIPTLDRGEFRRRHPTVTDEE